MASLWPSPPPREILHVDVDAFFASVEQRDDPRLRGKPVAVGTGVVASCSYEARRYGVRTAMRLSEARQLCRPLIVLPGQYLRYEQVARQLYAVCRDQTPLVEAAALDDLYLDVTAGRQERGEAAARTLLEQVRWEIGISLSIGLGANKLIAAVATREVKQAKCRVQSDPRMAAQLWNASPGFHLVRVPPGEEEEYLAPWPVSVLPGAGPRVRARLDRLNVHRVGQVAEMPRPMLEQMFGAVGGKLSEYAHGIDRREVVPQRRAQSISRRTSFDPPVSDPDFVRAMLDYLVERAASWLRYQDLTARGVTVLLRYGDYESAHGHEALRQPTQHDEVLKEAARERLHKIYTRRLPLRLLGVELTPLGPAEQQTDLFPDAERQRLDRLAECKDAIRRRFGFTSLLSGNALWLSRSLDRDRANFRLRTPCLTR
jgi:DNA polymerase-4